MHRRRRQPSRPAACRPRRPRHDPRRGRVHPAGRRLLQLAARAGAYAHVHPLGTRSRLQDRFQILPLTLNGEAYTDSAIYRGEKEEIDLGYDMEAIRWLRENVVGSPVVLEAAIPHQYRWGSRVSTYTGLPTVVGWIWHQKQQRGLDRHLVDQRQRQVEFIYSTTDSDLAFDLIKKYDVEFIYVGQLERLYYNEDGLKKFADTTQLWHQLVYSNAEVQIYKVLT